MRITMIRGAQVGSTLTDEVAKTVTPETYLASDGSTWGLWCSIAGGGWVCFGRRKDLKGLFEPASEMTAPTSVELKALIEKQIAAKQTTAPSTTSSMMSGSTPWIILAAVAVGAFFFGRSSN